MQFALNVVLISHIIRTIYKTLKEVKVIGLIIVGVLSVTLMSIMGFDSGRLVVSFGIIGISLFLLVFFKQKITLTKLTLIGILLISFFSIAFLISYFFSPAAGSEYGVWKIRQYIILAFIPAFLILITGKLKEKEMSMIESFIIFSSVVTALVVLYNAYAAGGLNLLQSDWFERQSIGAMNPIWLSRFLGLGLLVLQAPRFEKKTWLVLPLSIILIIASLMTGSKTVLYFTIPVIILYRLLNSRFNKKLFIDIALISGLVSLVFLFLTSINSAALMNRFSLESGTVGMREVMYQLTYNAYLNSSNFGLIFGNGGGTIGESLGYGFIGEYPHNLLIEVLYEMGIVGVTLLVLQLLLAVLLFLKGKRNWVFFAYILHFLFSLTSGDLASNDLVFTLFALYLVSDRERVGKKDERTKKRKRIVWP